MARKNKTKKEIVSDMQLIQDADRRRSLIKDIIFPYLTKMDDSIAYSKIFLQSFSGVVEGVYEENRKRTTVSHIQDKIIEKLQRVFTISDPVQKKEYDRYAELVGLLKDVSIQDLAYATELPRFIDGYLMTDVGKESIKKIPIEKLLG